MDNIGTWLATIPKLVEALFWTGGIRLGDGNELFWVYTGQLLVDDFAAWKVGEPDRIHGSCVYLETPLCRLAMANCDEEMYVICEV